MATKLGLYQGALRELGEGRLSGLAESRKPRYLLDDVYEAALKFCLEQASWNFAMRQVKIDYNSDYSTNFGRSRVFDKPEDWVRTFSLCYDEHFHNPIVDIQDRTDYWLTDCDTIYVEYVSNDEDYGLDLNRWPSTYELYVQRELANRIHNDVKGQQPDGNFMKLVNMAKRDAMAKDAMNDGGPKIKPAGSWVRSRGGGAMITDKWSR